MLKEIGVKNYRSWADSGSVPLAPLTGFFGTNSSGKSSLLRFLLMLKQTAESRDRGIQLELGGQKDYVELGSPKDVIFNHNDKLELAWTLCWDGGEWPVEAPTEDFRKALKHSPICFNTVQSLEGKSIVCQSMSYSVGDFCFGLESSAQGGQYELTSNGYELLRPQSRPRHIGPPVKSYAFPDSARLSYTNADFLQGFELSFERALDAIQYLGPLREDPQRQYTWSGASPRGVGSRGESVVDALLTARQRNKSIQVSKRKKVPFEAYIAQWLKKLQLVHDFKIVEISEDSSIYQIRVQQAPRSAWVPITDVGFGVSQLLPVLALCFAAEPGSTIILEQPEIHLHPSVQAGLADLFLDAIKVNKVQIIVESHSEHFLQRLLRRVAEEEISQEDTALYFCENPGTGSTIRRLDVDLFGSIRNWPHGFFGDPLGESLATLEAAQKRRLSAA
jgi:predicted ATPase